MMATVQTLQEKGHPYSEICNEVGGGLRGWVGGCAGGCVPRGADGCWVGVVSRGCS